ERRSERRCRSRGEPHLDSHLARAPLRRARHLHVRASSSGALHRSVAGGVRAASRRHRSDSAGPSVVAVTSGKTMNERVHEALAPTVRVSYDADEILVRTSTPYQDVVLIDNERFGRVLLLDGATQVTTADEFIYHEMLAHVPIFSHGDVQDVLIIGGGDCGLAEEVLKHTGIRRVVQVELDRCVVDLSRRYLDQINAAV